MGILDKVKQSVQQGQHKLEDIQERRRLDSLLHDLGAAVYLDRTGKGTAAISADIERYTSEIRDIEAAGVEVHVPRDATPPPGTVGSTSDPSPSPTSSPTPPGA